MPSDDTIPLWLTRPPTLEDLAPGSWLLPTAATKAGGHKASSGMRTTPYPWDNRELLRDDFTQFCAEFPQLLRIVQESIGETLDVDVDSTAWRRLIGWWLTVLGQITLDRYRILEAAQSTELPFVLYHLYDPLPPDIPRSTSDFFHIAANDRWNEFVYIQISQKMGMDRFLKAQASRSLMDGSARPKRLKVLVDSPKQLLRGSKARLTWEGRFTSLHGTEYTFSEVLKFYWSIREFPKPSLVPKLYEPGADTALRNILRGKIHSHDVSALTMPFILDFVPGTLPTALLEGFTENWRRARRRNEKPRILLTTTAWERDDLWKFTSAQNTRNEVIVAQHGGTYGLADINTAQDFEISISNRFLTWGWGSDNPKILRGSSFLSKRRMQRGRRTSQHSPILVTLGLQSKYSSWIYSSPRGPQWRYEINRAIALLHSLLRVVSPEQLLIRPYPGHSEWRLNELLRREFPGVRQLTAKQEFRKWRGEAVVEISTYNGTSMLETIMLNRPCLITWNPRMWELNSDAAPVFERLRECGIFHPELETCIETIKNVHPRWENYWQSTEVQTAVHDLRQFAIPSIDGGVKALASAINSVKLEGPIQVGREGHVR